MREGSGQRYLIRSRLDKVNNSIGARALMRLRCGNLEEDNKYWLEEKKMYIVR